MADKFLIAPIDKDSGLQLNREPWLIPDNAFSYLQNAYVWRGRVRKRFGTTYINQTNDQTQTRLRVDLGAYPGGGPVAFQAPGAQWLVGQQFSLQYLVAGNLFTQWYTVTNVGLNNMLTNGPGVGTFNTANGNVTITGTTAGELYYYPSTPVMGIITQQVVIVNEEPTIAFDTQFAYIYTTVPTPGWQRLALGAATWTGNDSQFFWGTNWTGPAPSDKALFVTNFNQNEAMRYLYNGTWFVFQPQIDQVPDYLFSAQILVVFKNAMLAFNTWEGAVAPGVNYQNRCRYSTQFGSPVAVNSWRQDIPGQGNFIDAATTEAIITVEFIKDRLIVFFENSTWEMVYTSNNANPFVFQKLNTELGAYSPFSVVPFDKFALGIGSVGIHSCNGYETQRIDSLIPDEVFQINLSNNGPIRVAGIRDYEIEVVYWSFPSNQQTVTQNYPNQVLLYNYENNSWAINDESITAMGYFQSVSGVLWSSNTLWSAPIRWDSGSLQGGIRDVIGGNQQGFTFILEPDYTNNSANLSITNLGYVSIGGTASLITIICINHNFITGQCVYFSSIDDTGNIGATLNGFIAQITLVVDANTFVVTTTTPVLNGVYTGGGTVGSVAVIDIQTKEFNFYAKDGRNAFISKIDFLVDKEQTGQIQVDYFVSTDDTSMTDTSALTGALVGTGTLDLFAYPDYPYENTSSRVWHPVYFQGDGEVIQFRIYYNLAQLLNTATAWDDFQMHAMQIYATPSTSRLQ